MQVLQSIALIFEYGSLKITSKFSISYNPSFTVSNIITTIRNLSCCNGAVNQLAERFFLINDHVKIKSLPSITVGILTRQ